MQRLALSRLRAAFACLLLGTVLAATSHAGGPNLRYSISGTRSGDSESFQGQLRFGTENPFFLALLAVDGSMPAARGGGTQFSGSYEELNLLFVSFWSYEGNFSSIGFNSSGSGIRLFFGLLVFGTLEEALEGRTYSFSGVFEEFFNPMVDEAPAPSRQLMPEAVGDRSPAARLRRRSLSPETI